MRLWHVSLKQGQKLITITTPLYTFLNTKGVRKLKYVVQFRKKKSQTSLCIFFLCLTKIFTYQKLRGAFLVLKHWSFDVNTKSQIYSSTVGRWTFLKDDTATKKCGFFGISECNFCTGEMSRMKLLLYLFAVIGSCFHSRATGNQGR